MSIASLRSMEDDGDEDVPPPTPSRWREGGGDLEGISRAFNPSSRRKAGSSGPMFFDDEEDELLSEAPHSIFPGQSKCGGSQKKNKTETSCCSALGQPMELSACSSDLSHETAASCQPLPSPHGTLSSQALPMICERSSSFSGSRRSGRSRSGVKQTCSLFLALSLSLSLVLLFSTRFYFTLSRLVLHFTPSCLSISIPVPPVLLTTFALYFTSSLLFTCLLLHDGYNHFTVSPSRFLHVCVAFIPFLVVLVSRTHS